MKLNLVLLSLLILGCKNGKSDESNSSFIDSLSTGVIGSHLDTSSNVKVKVVSNNYNLRDENKTLPPQVAKAVKNSVHKEKTCDEMLKDYSEVIASFKNNSKVALNKLKTFINDPFFNECYNNNVEFRNSIDKLDEILENED
jgi:hypothetical protein